MAQLKDTVILGDARVTDTLYANELNGETLRTDHLVLNTNSGAASIEQNQLEFLSSSDVSYAKIISNTSGMLGLFSKRIIGIFPGDVQSAGASVGATNDYQNSAGLYLYTDMVIPVVNNNMMLGMPTARWSKIYTTALSIGNNENDTTYPFYVYNIQSRFFLDTSNHGVADRKFTIAGGSGTDICEMSFGREGIQAYTNAQAVKNLFLQPRGGNLFFGQASSVSTTAYSFQPNQNNKFDLGTSSVKWANIYATNLFGAIDTTALANSTTGSESSRTTYFLLGSAATTSNQSVQVNPLIRTYESYTSKKITKIDLVIGRKQGSDASTTPGIPGGITIWSGNLRYGYLKTAANLSADTTYTLPNAGGTIALTSDISSSVANYLPLTGGELTGNLILRTATNAHGDTPYIEFRRQATNDDYTDWRIYSNSSGVLKFNSNLISTSNNTTYSKNLFNFTPYTASAIACFWPGSDSDTDLGKTDYKWANVYATNLNTNVITCPSSTAASVFSVGVDFVDTTAGRRGHVGASTTEGAVGIYAAGNVYLRPSCTTASGATTFTSSHGVIVTSTAMYPAGTSTLGSSSNKWTDLYVNKINLGSDVNSNTQTFMISGATMSLSFGYRDIQAYTGTTATMLYLQYYGGNLQIGKSADTNLTRTFYGQYDFPHANGFKYSGMAEVTANVTRPIWFMASENSSPLIGMPVYNSNFTYNPSTGNMSAKLITPSAATYTTTTTAGIVFYNSSTLCGHIGAATSGTTPGSIGLQTTGQIVFRTGATLSSNVLDGDSGINFSSTGFVPKTNAAALDTAGALTLGSSTAQWTTTYTKQLTVDQHVTLAYNSSDSSLEFNFS